MKQVMDLPKAPLANGDFREGGAIEEISLLIANGDFQEGGAVEEVSLLIERSLLEELEVVAEAQDMAAASLIRRLLREYLHHPAADHGIPGVGCGRIAASISLDSGQPRRVLESMDCRSPGIHRPA